MAAHVARTLPALPRADDAPEATQRLLRDRRARIVRAALARTQSSDAAPAHTGDTDGLLQANRVAGRLQLRRAALVDIDGILGQTAALLGRARSIPSFGRQDEAVALASIALRDLDRRARAAGLASRRSDQADPDDHQDVPAADRAALGLATLDLATDEGRALASPLLEVARGHVRNALDRIARALTDLAQSLPYAAGPDERRRFAEEAREATLRDPHGAIAAQSELSADLIDDLLR